MKKIVLLDTEKTPDGLGTRSDKIKNAFEGKYDFEVFRTCSDEILTEIFTKISSGEIQKILMNNKWVEHFNNYDGIHHFGNKRTDICTPDIIAMYSCKTYTYSRFKRVKKMSITLLQDSRNQDRTDDLDLFLSK